VGQKIKVTESEIGALGRVVHNVRAVAPSPLGNTGHCETAYWTVVLIGRAKCVVLIFKMK